MLFGQNNKKRKRGEVGGLDGDDEHMDDEQKRRRKMFEERIKQIQLNNGNLDELVEEQINLELVT